MGAKPAVEMAASLCAESIATGRELEQQTRIGGQDPLGPLESLLLLGTDRIVLQLQRPEGALHHQDPGEFAAGVRAVDQLSQHLVLDSTEQGDMARGIAPHLTRTGLANAERSAAVTVIRL